MNTTFDNKVARNFGKMHTPLMINGKNLIKLQSIRSQSRTNVSSYEKIPRIDIPEKDISFISEILGKNIEKNSWLLSAFQKKPPRKQVHSDQEDPEGLTVTNPNYPIATRLPKIKETSTLKNDKVVKPKVKRRASNLIKQPKQPVDFYCMHISMLQAGNGTEVTLHKKKEYKYYVGPGNNDSLVNRVMKKKNGWVKVYTVHSAHFIWTQVRKSEIISTLPLYSATTVKTSEPKSSNLKMFPAEECVTISPVTDITPSKLRVYNRIERNFELCSKKRLFGNMVAYYKSQNQDPFVHIPMTFHIVNGPRDPNFLMFKQKFGEIQEKIDYGNDQHLNNIWLVKPGEATNRGIGISICSTLYDIQEKLEDMEYAPGKNRTYIIQKYIYRPLLYFGRKFDIRCYAIITCYNGNLQAFFYKEGYLRTAVAEFSMKNVSNKFIHLTNDAIQKKSSEYGKFEAGNKLSYQEFQEYIDNNLEKKVNFSEEIYPEILKLVRDSVAATCMKLDPNRRLHTFEILGYDFMIDEFYRPWLIEVNTNPCLALSGPYLAYLIPKMLEDALHITLDQFFHNDLCDFSQNQFVLVFNRGKQNIESSENIEIVQSDGESSESDVEAN